MKKYELLKDDTITIGWHKLKRIRALVDFGNIHAGELGGYIEHGGNLSHLGDAWVFDNADVLGGAIIRGNALVDGFATVGGQAIIARFATVGGHAYVYGCAKVFAGYIYCGTVFGDALIRDVRDIQVFRGVGSDVGTLTAFRSESDILVCRGCFSGTLDEFKDAVEKRHGDSKIGKHYKLIIQAIELWFNDKEQK